MRRAIAVVVLLASAGCFAAVSSGPSGGHPPGRARGWGHANPRLTLIAGTGIKFVAEINEDIFEYGGVWFRFSGGSWFRCGTYGGAWVQIGEPPAVFYKIPEGHAKHRVIKGRKPHPHGGPGHKGHGGGKGKGKGKGRWK